MWSMEINEIIGKNLAQLRKEKGLTQREVAVKLDFSDKSVSKWESGESMPSIDVLYKLGQLYEVKLDYFVTEEHTAEQHEQPKEPITTPSRYRYSRLIISLLSILVLWIGAVCLFIFTQDVLSNMWIAFVWAIPASFIMAIIFNSLWGKVAHTFVFISLLIWTGLGAIFLQLVLLDNIFWQVFILGVPLQLATILCATLVLKNKAHDPATIRARREYKKELALKRRAKRQQKAEQQKQVKLAKKDERQKLTEEKRVLKQTLKEEKSTAQHINQEVKEEKQQTNTNKQDEIILQKTKNENIIQDLS